MQLTAHLRLFLGIAVSTALLSQQALALVSLNDGTDKIYVTGNVALTRDSNIFANSSGGGDYIYSGGIDLEYQRKAGWIAVNGTIGVDISKFGKFSEENFQNPSFGLEFTKQTGRTTGALNLGAQRQSRADPTVNVRNTSWNYNAALNVHYPVIERYSLSGGIGYNLIKYLDNPSFVDLASYSANISLFYILSETRDLFAGYRYRYNETPKGTYDTDNSVNIGVSGRIIPRLNGSVSVGYQVRTPSDDPLNKSYKSVTAAATITYAISKKMSLTGRVAKDFSATASDVSLDTLTASLDLQYAFSAKLAFSVDTGYGKNRFLGPGGYLTGTFIGREDTSLDWGARVSYTYNQHLSVYLSYSYMKNWSNADFADFERGSWSAGASSRW